MESKETIGFDAGSRGKFIDTQMSSARRKQIVITNGSPPPT